MRITVVALGKIGLPLAVQFARSGHTVIGADVNQATVDLVNAGTEPSPVKIIWPTTSRSRWRPGACPPRRTPPRRRHQRRRRDRRAALRRRRGVPDFGWMDDATRAVAAGLRAGTLVSYETTFCRSGPPAIGSAPCWPRALDSRLAGTSRWCSHRNGSSPGAFSRTCGVTRSWSAGSMRPALRPGWPSTIRYCSSMSAPTWLNPMACGTWAAPGGGTGQSSPRPRTAMSASAWPTSSRYADARESTSIR